jgi:hypothetical protein
MIPRINSINQTVSKENCSVHMEDDKPDINDISVNCIVTHKNDIGSIQLPTLWLPKYWPKKVKEVKRLRLLTLPAKRYISDPTFDGFYCMKSSMGCLFGAVQCVSAIIMSCMRLQNIDTMHTMDVISMFSSYMLLCMVIHAACGPAYYCKPVVCLPKLQLGIYEKINNELSFRKLRLCIHWFFDKNWAKILVFLLLSTPICLMVILLIYINRNNTLLLSLSIVWILFVAVISPLIFLLCLLFLSEKLFFFQATIPPVLLIILIVCSCLVVTPEQKYPNSVNWLPHF